MRRMLHYSALLFGAIILLLAGLNVHVYVDLREQAIREKTSELERQAELRAQEIENSLQGIRFALEKVELLWHSDGGNAEKMYANLKAVEQQLTYVRALSIVGVDGIALNTSRRFPSSFADVRHRRSVAYHLDGGPDKYYLGAPDKNEMDGDWQLPFSMAIRNGAGNLQAIIVAIIDPRAYAKAFENAVSEDDHVTLLTRDFRLVARFPWLEGEMGLPQTRSSAYRALNEKQAISGVYDNPFSGERRIVAVRRIFNDQLIISSSRPLYDSIAGWHSLAVIITVISVLILLLGAGAAFVAMRMLRDSKRKAESLAALNQDLQDQTARAERLATVKSEFLATMSHEIRTPMNGVLGMAQALESLSLDSKARDYVSIIRESAEGLLGIINDILDFSRLEAGRLKVSASTIRLPALMDSMAALFAPACTQKQLACHTEVDPAAPVSIETDPVRLRQILVNLLGNAVKFTASGRIVLRAKSVILPSGKAGIRFEVEDTGPGIAASALGTIFERFAQEDASTSRKYGGTGLGLAICRRLAGLLGGQIGCQSEKGVGSLFWVELPVDMDEEQELPDAARPRQRAITTRQPRILCVDDNHVNRRIIEALLKPFCPSLTLAASGAEALALAGQQEFDVVLLDIHMPDMDGVETQHRLRYLPGGRDLYIVALTADVVPEALARYEMAGFDAVVAKPIELEKLLKLLKLEPQQA